MLRKRDNIDTFKAGMLSVGVHVVLLIALLISFNWKTTHPVNIAEVELWDSLPNTEVQKPVPPPEPVVKEEPKPVPKVEPVEKPKEVIKQEPKVDIALEKKKKELEQKKIDEKLKKEEAIKKVAQAAREDDLRDREKQIKENKAKAQKDALKQLQQEALADEKTQSNQQALGEKAAANAGVIGEYQNKIRTKIRGNVNKSLCGDGNPELKFDIGLLPTGQLSGSPKLIKSSGNTACDEAVERAIMASEPLPLPSDSSLFSQFRNLKLTFRPNDGS